jgi:hypothetical protein
MYVAAVAAVAAGAAGAAVAAAAAAAATAAADWPFTLPAGWLVLHSLVAKGHKAALKMLLMRLKALAQQQLGVLVSISQPSAHLASPPAAAAAAAAAAVEAAGPSTIAAPTRRGRPVARRSAAAGQRMSMAHWVGDNIAAPGDQTALECGGSSKPRLSIGGSSTMAALPRSNGSSCGTNSSSSNSGSSTSTSSGGGPVADHTRQRSAERRCIRSSSGGSHGGEETSSGGGAVGGGSTGGGSRVGCRGVNGVHAEAQREVNALLQRVVYHLNSRRYVGQAGLLDEVCQELGLPVPPRARPKQAVGG